MDFIDDVVHTDTQTDRWDQRQIQVEEFALSRMYNYRPTMQYAFCPSQAACWKPANWLSMLWNSEYLVKMLLLRV